MTMASKEMTSQEMAKLSSCYLFERNTFPVDFITSLSDFIEDRLNTLECCILWKRNADFMEMISKYDELPDIGKKEIIITYGSIRISNNFRTGAFEKIWEAIPSNT